MPQLSIFDKNEKGVTMNVFKLKKLENGIEVSNDKEYIKSIARFSLDKTLPSCKILDNYVVIVNDNDETADLKVICGPNKGACYKNIDKTMLVRPNLLPCFMKDAIKWQDAVNMIRDGIMPDSVMKVCNNVLEGKKDNICKGLVTAQTRDSILTIKVLEETLSPYLGPLGLALVLNELTRRLMDEKEEG